jgi:amino acid adenylation domain-containing protein/non-ribosomal peptide synthase protein (TIGR01720 family)
MIVTELIGDLMRCGVQLWAEDSQLCIRAPQGTLTQTQRQAVTEHKVDLLGLLHAGTDDQRFFSPLSYNQRSIWFCYQLAPESAAYNVAFAAHICSDIAPATLRRSFQELVGRHPLLRTTYQVMGGEPMQQIHQRQRVHFEEIDASGVGTEELRVLVDSHYRRPFCLEQGPVLRVSLFTQAAKNHVLLVTVHHIACDGSSLILLLNEFGALYPTLKDGRSSPLPPLKAQYADYVLRQIEWLAGPEAERQYRYWQEHLAGNANVLNLPLDWPRPSVRSFAGASQPFRLGTELTGRLRRLGMDEEATLHMVLLAGFQVLLARYSQQEDILVGSSTFGRNRAEFSQVVGHFVNPVVTRADLSGDPTFRNLLRQTRHSALAALEYQEFPFLALVERLQPERNLSHTPIFQVLFALQTLHRMGDLAKFLHLSEMETTVKFGGLDLAPFPLAQQEGQFDLKLDMQEIDGELFGVLQYNTDLFEAGTPAQMVIHFQRLLEQVAASPNERLSSLPFLTSSEWNRLLFEWNQTHVPYPDQDGFQLLFERQAYRAADSIAVEYGDQQLSYRELNGRADQLAHYLRRCGVGPEVLVGIFIECSIEMLVSVLGVLKAGGGYVPLDPASPLERLSLMLDDARPPIILTQEHLVDKLPTYWSQVLCLDTQWAEISQESGDNLPDGVGAETLAYVIYTSGSTGEPKGTMIRHAGLVNYLHWCLSAYDVEHGCGAPVHSPFTFDLTVTSLLAPLLAGKKVVMLPASTNLEGLADNLRREAGHSFVKLTPAHLAAFSQSLSGSEIARSTRVLIIGGDTLTAELLSAWRQDAVGVRFINEYGPTETVVGCCVYELPAGRHEGGAIPIGRPINNTRVFILDRELQPVPVGVASELYIGGAGLMRGYLNRPELSAEKLIPSPFGSPAGSRLYRTGDLARYQPDGNIEFLGRTDLQVKIRGFRIELSEIEMMLCRHQAVREAVVIAREDAAGNKQLTAYLTSSSGSHPSANELRGFLGGRLPEYMLPLAYVWLDKMPLTTHGKVDRKMLTALGASSGPAPELSVAPRNQVETLLSDIWAQVLRQDQVSVLANFFELGGDSILGMRVIALANQAGMQLRVDHLFQYPTISQLAQVVGTGPVIEADQSAVSGPLPLTPIQRWFFDHDFPNPSHWNLAVCLDVIEPLDQSLLNEIIIRILDHHDALRLRFVQNEGCWRQFTDAPNRAASFERIDLAGLTEEAQRREMELTAARLQAGLNLSEGPLLRGAYFDTGLAQADRCLIVLHHLVADVVSLRIVLEDIQTGYDQLRQGQKIKFPPKTTSYKRWAERLQEYSQSESLQREADYWGSLSRLSAEFQSLPVDHHSGANLELSARSVSISLDPEETRTLLEKAPRVYRAQIDEVLLTALAQSLSRWSGARAQLVDLESHGREALFNNLDLSRTVGWFTAIFPVRLDLRDADHPLDALKSVKEQLRRVPGRGLGYGVLRYLSGADFAGQLRMRSRTEINFNYLGQLDQILLESAQFRIAGIPISSNRHPQASRPYLLEVISRIAGGRLHTDWIYSENRHRRETIETLAETFVAMLRTFIRQEWHSADIGYTPSDFPRAGLSQQELETFIAKISNAKRGEADGRSKY